jgi:hypothetical protein
LEVREHYSKLPADMFDPPARQLEKALRFSKIVGCGAKTKWNSPGPGVVAALSADMELVAEEHATIRS